MAYDGTVKIGTELDSSGIKKGIEDINGTAKSGFSKFSEIGKNALSVFAGNMLTEVAVPGEECCGSCPGYRYELRIWYVEGASDLRCIRRRTGSLDG